MRIGIITQYYSPEPVRIATQIAEGLAELGHEVWVVTGFPNYPEGQVYPGYRQKLTQTELTNGVTVHRVPMVINHSQAALLRILNYASFALSSFIKGSQLLRDTDVVYVYAAQMTPAMGPAIWRLLRRTPFVLHVQDLWPESITESSLVGKRQQSIVASLLNPWLRYLYHQASATIAIAPTMAKLLRTRGVAESKLHVVFNWTNEPGLEVGSTSHDHPLIPRRPGVTNFVYAGNLGDMQDLDTIIRAAVHFQERPEFHLYIVGNGVREGYLKQLVADLELRNVTFLGRVSSEEMWRVNDGSDFQLVTLKNLEIFRGTIPSKLQNALLSAKPIISTVPGDVAALIGDNSLGLVAEPENPQSLTDAFERAMRLTSTERTAIGERARAFYENNMSLRIGIQRIESILRNAVQDFITSGRVSEKRKL